jgi:hypothetical protein
MTEEAETSANEFIALAKLSGGWINLIKVRETVKAKWGAVLDTQATHEHRIFTSGFPHSMILANLINRHGSVSTVELGAFLEVRTNPKDPAKKQYIYDVRKTYKDLADFALQNGQLNKGEHHTT